jgi:putative DNA primase/helicase
MTSIRKSVATQLSRALSYASYGWRVLPLHSIKNGACTCSAGSKCQHAGKHPRTARGVKNATTDVNQIKVWWQKWPDANIGIATGRVSQIIVVDIDGDEGKGNFDRLIEANGRVPKTVIVKTPRGRHIYFKAPGYRVLNSASRIAPGIDVRGDGGYVVAPGSTTADAYAFKPGRGPDEIEVAVAPEWLLKKMGKSPPASGPQIPAEIAVAYRKRAEAYANAALTRELDRLKKAPLHQRNNTLNACAFNLGQFLPHGLFNETRIAAELTAAASGIGLGESEIAPTIKSGFRGGRQSPRRMPFLKSDERGRSHPATPATALNGPDDGTV